MRAGGHDDQLDPLLVQCLEKPGERAGILKLDGRLAAFVLDSSVRDMEVPPVASAFHRKILHTLADRYGLSHPTYATADGGVGIGLFKTADTVTHPVTLETWLSQRERSKAAAPPMRIMRRKAAATPTQSAMLATEDVETGSRRKELEYEAARAALFVTPEDVVDPAPPAPVLDAFDDDELSLYTRPKEHALEVFDYSPSLANFEIDAMVSEVTTQYAGRIKFLLSGEVLVLFDSLEALSVALHSVHSPEFRLRPRQ